MIKNSVIKDYLNVFLTVIFGLSGLIFSTLIINSFDSGVIFNNSKLFLTISLSVITVLTVLSIFFFNLENKIFYRISFIVLGLIFFFSLLFYILIVSGFFDKIDNVEDLRTYVSSFGSFAVVIYIVLQFLQVVVLPLPSVIVVGAGVLLFGPLKAAIFSAIGIISGSLVAFFFGRIFGYKVVKWLIGKDNLEKGLKAIKGKDKVVLSFMFLFPFFPDDVLCFVSGITTVSPLFFVIMIFITRLISIFTSAFSMNNNIIPYTTWWGILIWILFFAFTVCMSIFIYKKGDKIEKFFKRKR